MNMDTGLNRTLTITRDESGRGTLPVSLSFMTLFKNM